MQGRIFDIQRFSIYDGPGIRTNVFFKGCPLRCRWCHNPESQHQADELMFYKHKCKGCGKCAEICSKTFTADCVACGKCVDVCVHGAREISGKTIPSEEVVKTVLKDAEFYRTSGGGVTLSGGEPLAQPEFAAEILKACKEAGINTAIETAGAVSWECFEKVLPYTDLFLYDIKGIDEEKHIYNTGLSNKLILENAEKLKKTGVEIRFRMPVIPGYNMDEAADVRKFTGSFPLELMAYHKTGNSKYTSLGRCDMVTDAEPPTKEEMTELAEKIGAIYNYTGV